MFEVGGWDSSSKTITFGKGGFQGTRGDGYGAIGSLRTCLRNSVGQTVKCTINKAFKAVFAMHLDRRA